MITSLLKVWHSHQCLRQQGWTKSQRLELSQQWLHPTTSTFNLQQTIHDRVEQLPLSSQPLDDVHNLLNQFPATTTRTSKPPVYKHDLTPFRRFQAHHQALCSLRSRSILCIFQAWYHVQQKDRARRQMKQTSKLARKHRLKQVYDAAVRADEAQNPFRMFQAIRELAPKQTYKRILLRSDQGVLLSPEQAADNLCEWLTNLYCADQPQYGACSFDWPFSQSDFQHGLEKLPLSKALAPEYAPAPFWRCAAGPIAAHLTDYFRSCSQMAELPRCWSSGFLCFLPKPHKRSQHPKDLRPIALLEPSGKVLMGNLAHQLHEQLWPLLRGLPQFAYAPGRSCEDALHRVIQHCTTARQLIALHKYPIHNQSQGTTPGEMGGGLILSLDLSKAFDAVDRNQLFQGLERLGVTDDLVNFLKSVYSCTSFSFEHRGCTRTFTTTRGIRQGCKAAPGLWAAQAALLLLSIAESTSTEWMKTCSTVYADDACFHEVLHDLAQLERLLTFLGKVLDVLEAANLHVNFDKTTAMMRLVGPLAAKAQRRFVKRGANGGAWLKIPRTNGQFTLIKLVSQQQYLGATISYHNFENDKP